MSMPVGKRGYHSARLTIAETTAVPAHMRPRMRELMSLEVPVADRRQGLATGLLERVAIEADGANTILLIVVKPYDEDGITDLDALQKFYAKFGFVTIQQEPVLMARQPKATRRIDLRSSIAAVLH